MFWTIPQATICKIWSSNAAVNSMAKPINNSPSLLLFAAAVSVLGSRPAAAQNANDPGKGGLYRSVPAPDPNVPDRSHSHFGSAFDQGPRQHAHLMTGVGNAHFTVTTRSPMAQKFFDQGLNQLYCFSWYEAERSFREAAYRDPDCAMAYWGMAMCDNARGKEFLDLGDKRKAHITDHERRYIDALKINFRGGDEKSRVADNIKALEELTTAYPTDIEAKAMLAWSLFRQQKAGDISYRTAIDALLKQVLAANPMHPGAHHFRIHLWDGTGAQNALDSCKLLGKAAPIEGHALHMPGHIYARLGMWDEAVTAMSLSARVERAYFSRDRQMPFESWDYAHDQDFLISCLGYAGRLSEGAALSWELIDIPHDPDYNNGAEWTTAGQGRFGLMRMRIRGEKWDEILANPDDCGWTDTPGEKAWRAYSLALAAMGKNDQKAAEKYSQELEAAKAGGDTAECARLEIKGRMAVLWGDAKAGVDLLKKAAETEKSKFKYGDPIGYPRPLYETLAWAQTRTGKYADADATLEEGLQRNPGSGFALCLQIENLMAQNKKKEAKAAYESLRKAWRQADASVPALKRVLAFDLGAPIGQALEANLPGSNALKAQEAYGPDRWSPFPTPDVTFLNPDGRPIRLDTYRGKNLLLVFTLGGACPKCNKQVNDLMEQAPEFAALDTQIITASTDTPGTIKAAIAGKPNIGIQIVSDPAGAAARKFKAVDEFEGLDLHALFLIDKQGRVWWYRNGVTPYTDFAFLKKEIARMEGWSKTLARRASTMQPAGIGVAVSAKWHPQAKIDQNANKGLTK
jgi:peroxiredoxin